jgi:Cd2+/Zn2+-exporting ATPase
VEVEVSNIEKISVSTIELAEHKRTIFKAVSGLLLLLAGIIFREEIHNTPYHIAEYSIFGTAYLIVGWKVLSSAVKNIIRGRCLTSSF